jgi:predicted DNA-binding protein (UPF0251 family)
MPRPRKYRRLAREPHPAIYKPVGVKLGSLDCTVLLHEELEALRLADLESRHQEDAAGLMAVSRSTFQRILSEGRRKVSQALVTGSALQIEGGTFRVAAVRWHCDDCRSNWMIEHGSGQGDPGSCPECGSRSIRERRGRRRRH